MDGFPPPLAYAPFDFTQTTDNTPIEAGLSQCLPQLNDQFQQMLEIRKKIFEADHNSDGTTTNEADTPQEIQDVKKAVAQAKTLYQDVATEFISSTELTDDIQRYLERFNLNVKAAEALENMVSNSIKLPEHIRDLFMQHMSLLKPVERDIVTELEKYQSSLEEKKKYSSSVLKALSGVFNTVQSLSGYRSCPVCLSNEVSYYLVPCGHTFCTTCLDKHKGSCFLCRKNISTYNRLYFT